MNGRGQLGPQGLEDLPMAIMAFIVAVASVIIFMDISASHLGESELNDMHDAGKRLAETLSGEAFKSELSRSYGSHVLDGEMIERASAEDPSLRSIAGSLEYLFWAEADCGARAWEFGEEPPESALSYGAPVTILLGGELHNGGITVKIWRR